MDTEKRDKVFKRYYDRLIFERNQIDIQRSMAVNELRTFGATKEDLEWFDTKDKESLTTLFIKGFGLK